MKVIICLEKNGLQKHFAARSSFWTKLWRIFLPYLYCLKNYDVSYAIFWLVATAIVIISDAVGGAGSSGGVGEHSWEAGEHSKGFWGLLYLVGAIFYTIFYDRFLIRRLLIDGWKPATDEDRQTLEKLDIVPIEKEARQ